MTPLVGVAEQLALEAVVGEVHEPAGEVAVVDGGEAGPGEVVVAVDRHGGLYTGRRPTTIQQPVVVAPVVS